jgi:hypothetical protein
LKSLAFKKKLYRYGPRDNSTVLTQASKTRVKAEPSDPRSLERGVRQLLADKVTGNLLGLALLTPELLRLGAWDLVRNWTGKQAERVEPRLALQLVHEAALCVTGVRRQRALNQRGFELLNGLPFLASDMAIHELLGARTVLDSQRLQVALGKLRRASGHYHGRVLAIDPHRVRSFSKRHMRRQRIGDNDRPVKIAQMFFVLDADTKEPLCLATATSARTATAAAQEVLRMAADILNPEPGQSLVLADKEHYSAALFDYVRSETPFDLLVPMPSRREHNDRMSNMSPDAFQPRWAGYATAKRLYILKGARTGPFHQFIQRTGERPEEYHFKGFLATSEADEVEALSREYPKRWHIDEFFNTNQALGWDRAGTANLNIRYGQMTMALIAEAGIRQFRKGLKLVDRTWDAQHLAQGYFAGLEGDARVVDGDTIQVTYYNARDAARLQERYRDLPVRLKAEGVDPRVPWLYGMKLSFCFR